MIPHREAVCATRAHCPTCRRDAAWRADVGMPDVCPDGLTPETADAAHLAAMAAVNADAASALTARRARIATCRTCPQFEADRAATCGGRVQDAGCASLSRCAWNAAMSGAAINWPDGCQHATRSVE